MYPVLNRIYEWSSRAGWAAAFSTAPRKIRIQCEPVHTCARWRGPIFRCNSSSSGAGDFAMMSRRDGVAHAWDWRRRLGRVESSRWKAPAEALAWIHDGAIALRGPRPP